MKMLAFGTLLTRLERFGSSLVYVEHWGGGGTKARGANYCKCHNAKRSHGCITLHSLQENHGYIEMVTPYTLLAKYSSETIGEASRVPKKGRTAES